MVYDEGVREGVEELGVEEAERMNGRTLIR
jgi:hypothetical protein